MKSDYQTAFERSPKFQTTVLQPMRLALMLQEQEQPCVIEMGNAYSAQRFDSMLSCQ